MANLLEVARQAPVPAGFSTGEALPLPAPGTYQAVEISPPRGEPIRLEGSWPERWLDTADPGLYRVTLRGADGSRSEYASGARAGDAVESDLRPRDWVETIGASAVDGDVDSGAPPRRLDLRGWLLGAVVLLLIMEAFLAWRR
jgi:hypothetical protein